MNLMVLFDDSSASLTCCHLFFRFFLVYEPSE